MAWKGSARIRAPKRPKRGLWVGWKPYGMGETKPNASTEMAKTVWENRDNLPYAYRILHQGVCDGCALGVAGVHDWTITGVHLCSTRLNLLRTNTIGALDPAVLGDVAALRTRSSQDLRALGRLAHPMVRRRSDAGFTRVSWDEALDLVASRIRATVPDRLAFYMTARGITNETYYVAQQFTRFVGTNNIDIATRTCHGPSTVALKQSIGVAATTCSYADVIESEFIVLFGSNPANAQPVFMKYLFLARKRGGRVAVVNPYRVNGVLKVLVERRERSTAGSSTPTPPDTTTWSRRSTRSRSPTWSASRARRAPTWSASRRCTRRRDPRSSSGRWGSRSTRTAPTTCWPSPTSAWCGERGQAGCGAHADPRPLGRAGRRGDGCLRHRPPRRTGGERGQRRRTCRTVRLPRGRPARTDGGGRARPGPGGRARHPLLVGWQLPRSGAGARRRGGRVGGGAGEGPPGHRALEPDARRARRRGRAAARRHALRAEWRRHGDHHRAPHRLQPRDPRPRPGEVRSEWEIFVDLARRVDPSRAHLLEFASGDDIRREIARVVPVYAGIEDLHATGDSVQWGGRLLCEGGEFPLPEGRARFVPVTPPDRAVPDGMFRVSTRRGKQFNSMVHAEQDPLTGATRDSVFMADADMARLGLRDGSAVVLRSEHGELPGRVLPSRIRTGNLQVFFPEGNVLLAPGVHDPGSRIPDFNAVVSVHPA